MRIYLGTDHAGFEFKNKIKEFLVSEGHEVIDCGPENFDPHDDYPDYIGKAAKEVSNNPGSFGIVIGGSGQGEQMTANKFKGVRCSLFYATSVPPKAVDIKGKTSSDPFEIIKVTREHNNANMLSVGIRFLSEEDAKTAIKIFIETPFPGEERHVRRINKIAEIEK
jgi:ribose 5-phosphate isomerase B